MTHRIDLIKSGFAGYAVECNGIHIMDFICDIPAPSEMVKCYVRAFDCMYSLYLAVGGMMSVVPCEFMPGLREECFERYDYEVRSAV